MPASHKADIRAKLNTLAKSIKMVSVDDLINLGVLDKLIELDNSLIPVKVDSPTTRARAGKAADLAEFGNWL